MRSVLHAEPIRAAQGGTARLLSCLTTRHPGSQTHNYADSSSIRDNWLYSFQGGVEHVSFVHADAWMLQARLYQRGWDQALH